MKFGHKQQTNDLDINPSSESKTGPEKLQTAAQTAHFSLHQLCKSHEFPTSAQDFSFQSPQALCQKTSSSVSLLYPVSYILFSFHPLIIKQSSHIPSLFPKCFIFPSLQSEVFLHSVCVWTCVSVCESVCVSMCLCTWVWRFLKWYEYHPFCIPYLLPIPTLSGPFIWPCLQLYWASLVAHLVKNLPAVQETGVRSLGWEDPLQKGMATHSSILAWKISWTQEPGGLQSMGLQRVGRLKLTYLK